MDKTIHPDGICPKPSDPTRPTRLNENPNPHPMPLGLFATGRNRRKRRVAVEKEVEEVGGSGRKWEGTRRGVEFGWGKTAEMYRDQKWEEGQRCSGRTSTEQEHGSEWDVVYLYCTAYDAMQCRAVHMLYIRQLQLQVRLELHCTARLALS